MSEENWDYLYEICIQYNLTQFQGQALKSLVVFSIRLNQFLYTKITRIALSMYVLSLGANPAICTHWPSMQFDRFCPRSDMQLKQCDNQSLYKIID